MDFKTSTRPAAVVVGLELPESSKQNLHHSLEELRELAASAGCRVIETFTQNRGSVSPRFYIGAGKVEQIRDFCRPNNIELVIFNHDLSPSQIRNLQEALRLKIIDRSELILDIFAQRARTHEAKLQVELAQLKYLLPRLTHLWVHLSRLGGTIGTRGPGETQLETDRRLIRRRLSQLDKEIEQVRTERALHRRARQRQNIPTVTLVGYTNVGKSTLLNALTGSQVGVQDRLFATLDPTTRRLRLANNQEVLFTDTVGFIEDLPPQLIAAFRATLEEVGEADLLIHVADASSPRLKEQMACVFRILEEIGAAGKPMLTALNKIDLVKPDKLPARLLKHQDWVPISAAAGLGLDKLLDRVGRRLAPRRVRLKIKLPYDRMNFLPLIHDRGQVLEEKYLKSGVRIEAEVDSVLADQLKSQVLLDTQPGALLESSPDKPSIKAAKSKKARR